MISSASKVFFIIDCEPSHTTRYAQYLQEHKLLLKLTTKLQQHCIYAEFDSIQVNELLKDLRKERGFIKNMRRIVPYDVGEKGGYEGFLENFLEEVLQTEKLDQYVIRIMCFPKSLDKPTGDYLFRKNLNLHPTNFDRVLSLVNIDGKFYYKILSKETFALIVRPSWESDAQVSSRAHFKIKEVFERVLPSLNLKGSKAIDIGAAPGGWTEFLSEFCDLVVAIDPSDLTIPPKPNVHHLKMLSSEATEKLTSYSFQFDILTMDANADARKISRELMKLARFLRSGAVLIMTVKLWKRSSTNQTDKHVEESQLILSKEFCDLKTFWLFANSSLERTIVAFKI